MEIPYTGFGVMSMIDINHSPPWCQRTRSGLRGVAETKIRIDGNMDIRQALLVKTTIEIPEALYKRAKIRAVNQGTTLRRLMLEGLERIMAEEDDRKKTPFLKRRHLLREYEAALKSGAFPDGSDSTDLISDDRSSREGALL
jgi:hypothetical protein